VVKYPYIYIVSMLLFTGCSIRNDTGTTPTENQSLNAVSPSAKNVKEKGFLQRQYDEWEQEDWEPNTRTEADEKNDVQQNVSQQPVKEAALPATALQSKEDNTTVEAGTKASEEINASETFKLQYYLDKWGRYIDNKKQAEANQSVPSNVERLDTMPGIGGSGSR